MVRQALKAFKVFREFRAHKAILVQLVLVA
jgi:hypothetical protein